MAKKVTTYDTCLYIYIPWGRNPRCNTFYNNNNNNNNTLLYLKNEFTFLSMMLIILFTRG